MVEFICERCNLPFRNRQQSERHTVEQCDYVFSLLQELAFYDDFKERNCSRNYVPRPDRSYCGNANVLPNGYARFGTKYECLRKGVGIGKCIAFR